MAAPSKFAGFAQTQTHSRPIRPVGIEAWTEESAQSLSMVALSSPRLLRGTTASLAIPLDEPHASDTHEKAEVGRSNGHSSFAYRPRREPLRRDSLERREALLKGKEGSRRRQRWENDRLVNNPWAQPPLPSDWEVRPTYPQRTVPYYLAPLWDTNAVARQNTEKERREMAKKSAEAKGESSSQVPRQVREKLKKAKASKGLLQELEEEVRKFVKKWDEKTKAIDKEVPRAMDSEDEEIVFIGRNGQMHDVPPSPKAKKTPCQSELKSDHLVFNSLADDHGASFGRWLVHSIANYYGLRTWSVTVGDPARREAYVGIKKLAASGRPMSPFSSIPRPLWAMV